MRPLSDGLHTFKVNLEAERTRLRERYGDDGVPDWERRCITCGQAPCPCPTCHGARSVLRSRWEYGKPEPRPVPCPDCFAAELEEKHAADAALGSGMEHHRHETFAAFPARAGQREQWEQAAGWCANPSPLMLWMTGPSFTGKTLLARCCANVFIQRGDAVLFRDVPALLDDLRETYADDSRTSFGSVMETLCSVPLLVLDDLGRSKPSEWSEEKLYRITKARTEDNPKPTICTTNWDDAQLDAQMNRMRYRILDTDKAFLMLFEKSAVQAAAKQGARRG